MKLASFFFLSLSLHVSVLVYPIAFHAPIESDLIDVTILALSTESSGAGGYGGEKKPSAPESLNRHRATPSLAGPRIEANPIVNPEPQSKHAEMPANLSESGAVAISSIPSSVEAESTPATSGKPHNDSIGGPGGIGGTGFGSSGTGFGQGSGNGTGSGSRGSDNALDQARYRDTPKPVYPESARRDGHEGSVLLRVLVDDQGRSKKIEILNRSGSEALDSAAVEAIKRWRFYPARRGDRAVESWLRIPIEFRLADAQAR